MIDLATSRLNRLRDRNGHDVRVFTYTVDVSEDVELFPKALACETGGVWSRIVDDQNILNDLTSYNLLFALGLGSGSNENFTAWVEPYTFATGGILGTTVSAPVYDRRGAYPVFLGVAGMDFSLELAERVLGKDAGSSSAFDRLIRASTARCPSLNLTECELESYRRRGTAGSQALCSNVCQDSDFIKVEEDPCPNAYDFPSDLWINRELNGLTYQDRVCCKDGKGGSAEATCGIASSSTSLSFGAIAGIAIACVFLIAAGVVLWICNQRRSTTTATPLQEMPIILPPGSS